MKVGELMSWSTSWLSSLLRVCRGCWLRTDACSRVRARTGQTARRNRSKGKGRAQGGQGDEPVETECWLVVLDEVELSRFAPLQAPAQRLAGPDPPPLSSQGACTSSRAHALAAFASLRLGCALRQRPDLTPFLAQRHRGTGSATKARAPLRNSSPALCTVIEALIGPVTQSHSFLALLYRPSSSCTNVRRQLDSRRPSRAGRRGAACRGQSAGLLRHGSRQGKAERGLDSSRCCACLYRLKSPAEGCCYS